MLPASSSVDPRWRLCGHMVSFNDCRVIVDCTVLLKEELFSLSLRSPKVFVYTDPTDVLLCFQVSLLYIVVCTYKSAVGLGHN